MFLLTRWREDVRSFEIVESARLDGIEEVKEMLGEVFGWKHYETNGSVVIFKEVGGGLTVGWTLEGLHGSSRGRFIEGMFYEA